LYLSLSECIVAACLAKSGRKVLHVDSRDFYGEEDGSLCPTPLEGLCGNTNQLNALGVDSMHVSFPGESVADRHYSIDISIPKVLFGRSSCVDHLINHDVSKYLSFASVKELRVLTKSGVTFTVPTSRNNIFKDKSLKLPEKRALMSLFKTSATTSSTAIESSASFGMDHASFIPNVESITAVELLETHFQLTRPELISAIIHGCCLYLEPARTMTASILLNRLSQFVSSLAQYEAGCPFLVPMYGNSDIPQAFARTAAVAGSLYILACDEDRLKSELKDQTFIASKDKTDFKIAMHGIVCCKTSSAAGDDGQISLTVTEPTSFDAAPVFVLALPNDESEHSGVVVCPPGHTLFHFVQVCSPSEDLESFKTEMDAYMKNRNIVFQAVITNRVYRNYQFSLENEFREARKIFNSVMGRDPEEPLPLPTKDSQPVPPM
jgi:hypothetical protein